MTTTAPTTPTPQAPDSPSATAPTWTSPTARHLWRRARGLLLAAAVLALAGTTLAALRSGEHTGSLDPRSATPYGSKALSRLLADRGVHTKILSTSAAARRQAGPDTTLLVPFPNALSERQLSDIRAATRRSGRTVLLAPGPAATAALIHGIRTTGRTTVRPTPPDCDFPVARRAGDTDLGGYGYTTDADRAESCYLSDGRANLLRLPSSAGRDTVLLGAADPLHNKHLADHGNASLSLQLLGSRPRLLWYLPTDATPADGQERGFFDLLPRGWSWAAIQLALAALLAAVWRARRLGPLVTEPLPVTIPAAEATEGRSRLYRKANDRGHAADALRAAARARLAPLLGVPLTKAHLPEVLIPALAGQASGRSPLGDGPSLDEPGLRALLFGPPPRDDAALLELAHRLDQLEQHLTSPSDLPRPPRDKDISS
ncbi:DUF4350 domain-containing protein [Streptomyces sp. NPDC053499]|uniref:DUF4350 domain-containing protein n=1 Tax=Streptomyces sp. NPDC053499 TaxID=3365707 RepID=UPI0037D3BAFE